MALALYPFQEDAARWLAPRYRAGLFDDMGVGKTAELIRTLDMQGATRGIVCTLATARANWVGEFAKFGIIPRKVVRGVNIHDFVAWLRGVFDVLVTSYEQAAKWAKEVVKSAEILDFVILDEGDLLKNADTQRAKAILGHNADGQGGMIQWAKHSYWATGTPIPNDPMDIWTFLRFAGVMPLTQRQFSDRYFDTRSRTYSTQHKPKPGMVKELQTLIGNNSIRRRLDDVGFQLPQLWATTYLVDGDTQAIRDMLMTYPGLDVRIIEAVREGRGLAGIDAEHATTLRRLIGEAKALPYAHLLMDELKLGLDKMIVFGSHRLALTTVRDYLAEHRIGVDIIYGDTPEARRGPMIHRFQTDPSLQVLLLNYRSGGAAITLTASQYVDLMEPDWTPRSIAQAVARAHRLTQTRPVRARFITLARSFDEVINEIVAEKAAAIAAVEGRTMAAIRA